MRLGDHSVGDDVQFVPTGSLALDIALGVGGIPRGRIIEIFGPESSGKTTLVYHLIAQAQRLGGKAAFIDAEHAMDPIYAKAIGVDVDDLLVSQPDYGEQALEIAEMLVRSGAIDIVAIDSVAALTPRAEIEGEMGDSFVGLQARLMSQALRKLAGTLNSSGTICCFTNQLREKIGVMFGNPETTTGGKALKFYATIRLDIRRIETLKDGTEAIGNRVRVKVVKNKVAPPFKQAEFDIMYGQGISREGTLLDLGVACEVVAKSGAFFSYNDERLGQGRANAQAVPEREPRHGRRHRGADPREGRPAARLGRTAAAPRRRGGRRASGRRRRPGDRRGPLGAVAWPSSRRCAPRARGRVAVHVDGELRLHRQRVASSRAGACSRAGSSTTKSSTELRTQASAERALADAYRLLGAPRPQPRRAPRGACCKGARGSRRRRARSSASPTTASSTTPPSRAPTSPTSARSSRLGHRAHPPRAGRAGRRRTDVIDAALLGASRRGRRRRARACAEPSCAAKGPPRPPQRPAARLPGSCCAVASHRGRLPRRPTSGARSEDATAALSDLREARRAPPGIDFGRRQSPTIEMRDVSCTLCFNSSLLHSDTDGAPAPSG